MDGDLIRRWLQFAQLVAGVLIFAAGLVLGAYSRPFRRDSNRALAPLGITGLLYGTRLLAGQPQVRDLFSAPSWFWLYLADYVTYVILVPMLLFFELTFGAGWHHSIRWMRWLAIAGAVAAGAIDAVTRNPGLANGPNGFLVVATIAVLVANTFLGLMTSNTFPRAVDPRDLRVVRTGLFVFAGFVLFENIVNGPFLHGAWRVEWAGVLVALGCLGYVGVSHAVENNRRLLELRHELETAGRIQASIMPRRMPAVGGLDIAARYLPMAEVAGDFYDFLELGAGKLGVLVADVSGHGVPAALIASMVKVALVAQTDHADSPARVLAGMNHVLCGRLAGQFVTAAYAYIDVNTEQVRYGAAGHPPALLVTRTGDVKEVTENGVMLGQFPNWPYTSVQLSFREGDRLILYTDGLTETMNSGGDFFDVERLREFGHKAPVRGATTFAGALVDYVTAWSGRSAPSGFDDDITVVVVDRC
jgi:sigma-B regulation protein RsbU (phosphoserine phosphatase)